MSTQGPATGKNVRRWEVKQLAVSVSGFERPVVASVDHYSYLMPYFLLYEP